MGGGGTGVTGSCSTRIRRSRQRRGALQRKKDGQEQVVHARGRSSNSSSDGVTCRGSYRFMIVKGQVKKELENFSCYGLVSER